MRRVASIDAIRFWGGVTDYKHNELGLADDTDPSSDGIRQIFTNKEQEARVEAQLGPVRPAVRLADDSDRRARRASGAHSAKPR